MFLMAFDNRFGHSIRKRRGKMLAIFIFQDLSGIRSRYNLYRYQTLGSGQNQLPGIDRAAGEQSNASILMSSGSSTYRKVAAHTSGLSTGLVVNVFRLFVALTIRARRRWLTVIALLRVKRLTSNCITNKSTSWMACKAGDRFCF